MPRNKRTQPFRSPVNVIKRLLYKQGDIQDSNITQSGSLTSSKSTSGVGAAATHSGLLDMPSTTNDDHLNYSRIDGTRAFTGTVGGIDPVAQSDLATKDYVDNAVAIIASFFYNDTASDIGGIYYNMEDSPTGDAESSFSAGPLGAGDDQAIANFATVAGVPGVITFKEGVYVCHVHAAVTAGTKPVTIYFGLYTRTSGGSETLRATSEVSGTITTKESLELHATIADDIDINNTDRIVVKWFANVGATGSDATVVLYAEGTNASRLEIPTTSDILSEVFVRQDGTKPFILGGDATGDMYYRSATPDIDRLGIGTAGQVLTVNSGATAPEWSGPPYDQSWTLMREEDIDEIQTDYHKLNYQSAISTLGGSTNGATPSHMAVYNWATNHVDSDYTSIDLTTNVVYIDELAIWDTSTQTVWFQGFDKLGDTITARVHYRRTSGTADDAYIRIRFTVNEMGSSVNLYTATQLLSATAQNTWVDLQITSQDISGWAERLEWSFAVETVDPGKTVDNTHGLDVHHVQVIQV